MKTLHMLNRDHRAMPHVAPVLENIGYTVRIMSGVEDLHVLKWSGDMVIVSSQTLEIMRDLAIRSIKAVLIVTPENEPKLRDLCEVCDGWITWTGGEVAIAGKLAAVLRGYSTLPSYTLSSTADRFQIERLDHMNQHQKLILDLLREGLTDQEMAARMSINVASVKMHVRDMLKLMCWRNRTEAALFAERNAKLLGYAG